MQRGPYETDRREQHKADEDGNRHQQGRLNGEDHHQAARAGKRQVFGILLRSIARQTVMALMHAEVGERRQQKRNAEQEVPGGFETLAAPAAAGAPARG